MCSKKGEKVSTPLDKDGRDLRGLITHMRQLSPTSGQPYFLIGCLIYQTIKLFPDMAHVSLVTASCRQLMFKIRMLFTILPFFWCDFQIVNIVPDDTITLYFVATGLASAKYITNQVNYN